MIKASVYDTINRVLVVDNGEFPEDWDDLMIKSAVSIERWGNARSAFGYAVTRCVATPEPAPEEIDETPEAAPVVVEERPVVVAINRKALVKEATVSVDPAHVTLTVTARDIRAGDVFTLHGHERAATHSTWPTALRNHVHISFAGGGAAVVPADRQFVVTRAKELGCATA